MKLDDLIKKATSKKGSPVPEHAPQKRTNRYQLNLNYCGIEDKRHLNNHLNYLFRTDAGQKWTNELTSQNAYAFCFPSDPGFKLEFARDAKERRRFKDDLSKTIENMAKAEGSTKDEFSRLIMQIRTDYLEPNVVGFTKNVEEDTVELLSMLERDNDAMRLICAVVHVDQKENYVHIHLLYCGK